jgi:hypothetical protein
MAKFCYVGMLIVLIGCATTMSDRASRIRIIIAEEAKQYDYVGLIQGSSSLSGVARHTGYQNALNEVLDEAAAKGAEFVVLDPNSKPSYWTTSQVMRAEAFKRKK